MTAATPIPAPAASRRASLLHTGTTFNVYGNERGPKRSFPSIVPRIVPAHEWALIERGLPQRARALNLFIDDVYHRNESLRTGVVPRELVESATSFLKPCAGLTPPRGIWCHVSGTNLVETPTANTTCSKTTCGVRRAFPTSSRTAQVMKRTFPRVFDVSRVRPVDAYSSDSSDLENVETRVT